MPPATESAAFIESSRPGSDTRRGSRSAPWESGCIIPASGATDCRLSPGLRVP